MGCCIVFVLSLSSKERISYDTRPISRLHWSGVGYQGCTTAPFLQAILRLWISRTYCGLDRLLLGHRRTLARLQRIRRGRCHREASISDLVLVCSHPYLTGLLCIHLLISFALLLFWFWSKFSALSQVLISLPDSVSFEPASLSSLLEFSLEVWLAFLASLSSAAFELLACLLSSYQLL